MNYFFKKNIACIDAIKAGKRQMMVIDIGHIFSKMYNIRCLMGKMLESIMPR